MNYKFENIEATKPTAKEALVFLNGEVSSMWREGWDVIDLHINPSLNNDDTVGYLTKIRFRKEVQVA